MIKGQFVDLKLQKFQFPDSKLVTWPFGQGGCLQQKEQEEEEEEEEDDNNSLTRMMMSRLRRRNGQVMWE